MHATDSPCLLFIYSATVQSYTGAIKKQLYCQFSNFTASHSHMITITGSMHCPVLELHFSFSPLWIRNIGEYGIVRE